MMTKSNHIFHMVDMSPWPIILAMSLSYTLLGGINWFHSANLNTLVLGMYLTLIIAFQWWRDVSREATLQGLHTSKVMTSLRLGMILFIVSEVMFFFSFFWAFFHSSLAPSMELGLTWPPLGVEVFNPLQIPLLNTIILLSSGVSVTWAHHAIMAKSPSEAIQAILLTVLLGVYFTALQALEYNEASFSISDSAYGASFFVATGFHGLHVMVGTSFLLVCLIRQFKAHFSCNHHFGFEAAAWYWHFVDIIWLFLYISIYWWGH